MHVTVSWGLTAEEWTALGTVVTAGVAVVAAAFAWSQLRLARQLREDEARPFVVVDFEPSPAWDHAIELVVENVGRTLATDVHISFDPPLRSSQDGTTEQPDIADTVLLREGIPSMPPGKRMTALFDLSHERVKTDLPMTYRAVVTYKDAHGKDQPPLTYVLDLRFRYGLQSLVQYGMHDLAKATREMSKTLAKATDNAGWKVSIHDRDYASWSDRWQYERSGRHPSMANGHPAGRPTPSKFKHLREPILVRAYWACRYRITRMRQAITARTGTHS